MNTLFKMNGLIIYLQLLLVHWIAFKKSMSNLLLEFKAKCRQQLGKLPESYFDEYIQGSALKLNLAPFRIQDIHFAEVLFSLTFKKIEIFQEEQSD